MDRTTLTDLFLHMQWAEAAVWAAVLSSDNARSDAQLRDRLYHLHMVQRAFLRLWRGEPRDAPYPAFDDQVSLMQWAQTYYSEALTHLGALDEAAISDLQPVPWAEMVERRLGRAPEATSVGETALQVVLHSMYH